MTELASNLGIKPEVISGAKKGAELAQGGMSGQYVWNKHCSLYKCQSSLRS